MESVFKYLLFGIAAVAIVTGLNVLLGGTSAVPGSLGSVDIAVDNELRFFSVFWLAYGFFCIWAALDLQSRVSFVPFIAFSFFLGGLARLSSVVTVGSPGSILIGAMVLELVLPFFLYILYLKTKSKLVIFENNSA